MEYLKIAIFSSLALLITPAFAQNSSAISYDCRLYAYVTNPDEVIETQFMAEFGSGSHGGAEKVFAKGSNSVTVQASNNWMAMTWKQSEKIIAAGIFAIGKPSDFSRAVLLLNPMNQEEQASLSCDPAGPSSQKAPRLDTSRGLAKILPCPNSSRTCQ